jgi:hypothetical protein
MIGHLKMRVIGFMMADIGTCGEGNSSWSGPMLSSTKRSATMVTVRDEGG